MNRIRNFNTWLAVKVTDGVGTMVCAYLFCVLAIIGLPVALRPGGIGFPNWFAEEFIQLVLLSIIMVGQKIQADTTIKHVNKKHDELKEHITSVHKGK